MTEPSQAEIAESPYAGRIRELRAALELTPEKMAAELSELIGMAGRVVSVYEWQGPKKPSPETLAAIAMLHPRDPRGCLKWLREGGEMPRIHVDSHEPATDAAYFEEMAERCQRAADGLRLLDEVELEEPPGRTDDAGDARGTGSDG